jgi:DNA-binding transcriptional MerR regulator
LVTLATTALLPIGRFSRLTGLTVKALRHYAEIGLLEPARVDEATGYRFYGLEQARRADAIRRLRDLELPLEEVRRALDGEAALAAVLAAHRERLVERIGALSAHAAELGRLIDGEEELVPEEATTVRFELHIEDVAEQRLLVVQREVPMEELKTAIPAGIEEVGGYLKELGVQPSGAPVFTMSGPDADGTARITVGWPTDAAPRPPILEHVLPATRALILKHTGPYEMLSRSYRLLEEVIANNELGTTGDPREVYVGDPSSVPPAELDTLIVWPVRPGDELKPPTGDYFKKRVEID